MTYSSNLDYSRQFDYSIIQNEDNKKNLLEKKKKMIKKSIIHTIYMNSPKNNSKILYSDELQNVLKNKEYK